MVLLEVVVEELPVGLTLDALSSFTEYDRLHLIHRFLLLETHPRPPMLQHHLNLLLDLLPLDVFLSPVFILLESLW